MYLERQIRETTFACSLNTLVNSNDFVIVGNKEGKIIVYNLKNGQIEKTFNVSVSPIVDIVVLEEGTEES